MAPYLSLYDDALQKFCKSVREDRIKKGDEDGEKQLQQFLASRATAQEARKSASVLQESAGKKYSGKKIGDKEVISQKWIDNILGNIGSAIAVGDKLLTGTPESVSMAWFCVKLGLNAMQSNYQLYSLFGSGLTNMTEIMILIPHYDQLYDERQKPGFESNDLIEKLFRDVTGVYVAVLDFLFSIKRHLEASTLGHVRHAFKDFFGAEVSKFQAKQDAIAVLKAKVLEDSDGAFQRRLFDQLGDVRESLNQSLDHIHAFASTAKDLAQGQTDILRELQDLKASVKPKTRWDWLKQAFDAHRKALDPLPETTGGLVDLAGKRHPGTTQWAFDTSRYKNWNDSSQSGLLCFTGQEGVGKSVVLATAIDKLESNTVGKQAVICFISGITGDGQQASLGSDPCDKIRRSLIYQVYKHAAKDEDKPEVLEECNKLFSHPKATKQQQSLLGKADNQDLPGFGETILKLACILHRNIIFVLDAIDRLTQRDQEGLFNALEDLLKRSAQSENPASVRVLTTCRTGEPFANRAFAKETTIDVEEGNTSDMESQLSSIIDGMVDWTNEERAEAKTKVLDKAGPRFNYISDIAAPFLRQPFQRPLSRRLEALPEGVADSYKQAISSMPSNYVDLLRTALTWTLHSEQPVRVKEIMEAFSGVYDEGREGDSTNEYSGYVATALELQQLQGASGPFLKITNNEKGQQIVALQNSTQIRKFCELADRGPGEFAGGHSHKHCARCQANLTSDQSLFLPEKQVHLDLALTLVRHLNSPLFLKRFKLLSKDDPDGGPTEQDQDSEDEDSASTSTDINSHFDEASGDTAGEQVLSGGGNANEDNGKDQDNNEYREAIGDLHADQADVEASVAEATGTKSHEQPEGAVVEEEYDSDDSQEDEDKGEIDIIRKLKPDEIEEEEVVYDGFRDLRYEMEQWFHHVREADRMWTAQEKSSSPQWTALIAELDKFAFENEPSFKQWQYILSGWGGYWEQKVDALHFAACEGLTYWAEHLIKDLGKDPNDFCGGRNALQAAALGASDNNTDMLKLLLSIPGADATIRGKSSQYRERSALQDWLEKSPSVEEIKLFIDSGADFTEPDEETNDTPLHFFAVGKATDPVVLEMILESGGTEGRPRPDINARNKSGNTPLHHLMQRRDVPTELLKAFIVHGADINAENHNSLRPLQSACSWSEPEVVKVLLETGIADIDDPDKNGTTALHAAAWAGSTECVRLLLSHGANINCTGKKGRRPLHTAARLGHKDALSTLIEHGASLNDGDRHDRSPFWHACNSESKETASTMLAALTSTFPISEINRPSKRQRTPLRVAATHGFSEIVAELIERTIAAGLDVKAMLDLQDTLKGYTALHRAAWRGELACVRLLLESGADASLRDNNDESALMIATEQWQMTGESAFEEIVALLIEKDQVQAKLDSELPATAASNGSIRVLEALFRIGADINKPDAYGWTPLTFAQHSHKTDIARFLKQTAVGTTLPSSWILHAAIAKTVRVSDNGLEISYTYDPEASSERSISTNKPLPPGLDRYYFEVTSRKVAGDEDELETPVMAIGFCTLGAKYYQLPGWPPKRNTPSGRSWAYHGDDGWFGAGSFSSQVYGEPYGPGDTIGCGVDLGTRRIWFTKNGKKLEYEHEGVSGRLFPIIGLQDSVSLETNFGGKKPFVWVEANKNREDPEL